MSGVVDWSDLNANMYGCLPCPQCGSVYRAAYKKTGLVECDQCGFKETAEFKEDDEQ